MKIVVLDGYTLNPGDLDWTPLAELGQLSVHERTPAQLVKSRAAGAQLLLTNKVALGREQIAALPDLRYIGVLATGVNVVDLDAATDRGIVVTNVPAYSTPSVAQHVFALLLELTRAVGKHAEMVRAGAWTQSPDFAFWASPQVELAGKAMGLIGYGRIGQAVARIARAFGMTVLVHTRTPAASRDSDAEFVGLEPLLERADVVSLHCPLSQATDRLINAERLAMMKPSAWLINTGRGALVDEAALAEALREGRLAGAGLDVLATEPPAADNPLLAAPNCLITPHLAWATHSARQRLMTIVVANLQAFLAGKPQNRVA
ncbi:MAG: glycerate dehydrogenase [Desulfuromonas sp.]|nr:MAG: glycerate dehydrogenase [Desulfuromonas sp.]